MPFTLMVKCSDEAARERRETIVQHVVECLKHPLLARRLLCFLDDEEWQSFKDEHGIANRGIFFPVTISGRFWRTAPLYIKERLLADGHPVFDDVIYLHGSTCSSDLGLTITLAHELQHFIQHSEQPRLWAANSLVPGLSKVTIRALGLRWCDLPHEREARIVSKRVAEKIYGAEVVRQHIDGKIAERLTEADAADWECIRGIATATPYDLALETKIFFPEADGPTVGT